MKLTYERNVYLVPADILFLCFFSDFSNPEIKKVKSIYKIDF